MNRNGRRQVLCVDDSHDTRGVLESVFPNLAFKFTGTYAEGITLARRGIFDLYLLDKWLPDGSGFDLCRNIRLLDANTPVIFMSGAPYSRDHAEAMAAGANAYLDKPVDMFRLEGAVTGLIREVESRSLAAKMAEMTAIQSEINWQLSGLDERQRQNAVRLNEALYKSLAYSTFIKAGGVKSNFDRLWPDVFTALVDGRDSQNRESQNRESQNRKS
ncbi:MAG TPA: response regulator [Blastocatellia bacterium]|nr:response regulator [Blastocatellia bacterium]